MRALIIGITAQDGAYLGQLLLGKGYDVWGLYRRTTNTNFWRLRWLGIENKIHLVQGDITDSDACLRATEGGVEAIQHVAATPYPTDHPEEREHAAERGVPFDQTMRTNIMGTYYLLQAAVERKIGVFVSIILKKCEVIIETMCSFPYKGI